MTSLNTEQWNNLVVDKLSQPNMAASSGLYGKNVMPYNIERKIILYNIVFVYDNYTNTIYKYIYKYNIIENNFSLNVVWHNIFPYRPDEAAMLGCESLSTTKLFHCSVFREVTYT